MAFLSYSYQGFSLNDPPFFFNPTLWGRVVIPHSQLFRLRSPEGSVSVGPHHKAISPQRVVRLHLVSRYWKLRYPHCSRSTHPPGQTFTRRNDSPVYRYTDRSWSEVFGETPGDLCSRHPWNEVKDQERPPSDTSPNLVRVSVDGPQSRVEWVNDTLEPVQ